MDNLIEFTKLVSQKVLKVQQLGIKELVEKENVLKAFYYVHNNCLKSAADVLQFCASMNLLNTYVKQDDRDLSYRFKGVINRLFIGLYRNDISNISIDFQKDSNSLVIIQIADLQFSFHAIKETDILTKLLSSKYYCGSILWDGIRKQMAANTVYKMIENFSASNRGISDDNI